jgi:hypothetical protein
MRDAWNGGGGLVDSADARWRVADRATAWARAGQDMRLWAGTDGLVASGPDRRQTVLAIGRAR